MRRLPDNQLSRLQSMLNATARLVFSTRKHESLSPLLRDLHWLRVPQRIDFKLAVLTYRCLHSTVPPYLANEFCRVADVDSRRRWGQRQRRPSSYRRCAIPLLATAHFRPRPRAYGTACRPASPRRRHWQFSGSASKQNSFSDVLARTVRDDSPVVILYAWLRTRPFCCKVSLQS